MTDNNVAVKEIAYSTAKKHKNSNHDGPIVLSTGVEAILKPLPSGAIQEAQSKIKDPSVPIQTLDDGREVENPTHPDYLAARQDTLMKRAKVGLDVAAALCVELVNGLPENDKWLKKLKRLERLGHIDLSLYDLKDEDDLEYIYIRFVALSNDDFEVINALSGISQEDVDAAKEMFQR